MRALSLALFVAACAAPQPARWDIDVDENLAVPRCAHCAAAVPLDGERCPRCDHVYSIESRTIPCPHCAGSGMAPLGPLCEACEDTGRCPICEGGGVFQGEVCPECEGDKTCRDCAADVDVEVEREECPYCLGTAELTLEPR